MDRVGWRRGGNSCVGASKRDKKSREKGVWAYVRASWGAACCAPTEAGGIWACGGWLLAFAGNWGPRVVGLRVGIRGALEVQVVGGHGWWWRR